MLNENEIFEKNQNFFWENTGIVKLIVKNSKNSKSQGKIKNSEELNKYIFYNVVFVICIVILERFC